MSFIIFHKCRLILLFFMFPAISGCAVLVLGIGAGVGTVAYVNGRLVKTYESDYKKTVLASADTLKGLLMPVAGKKSDGLKTTIKAVRPDGTPVSIDILKIDSKRTEVAVRTGSVGLWDRRVSLQIQNLIGKRLGITRATATEAEPTKSTSKANSLESPEATQKKQQGVVAAKTESMEAGKAEGPAGNFPNHSLIAEPSDFTLYFDRNSNELSGEQMKELDAIVNYILAYFLEEPNARVKLNGYTDSLGDPDYNKMISDVRASAIKFYLIGKGIPSENIQVSGRGAKNFISTNSTVEGRNKNRRVEIIVTSDRH